MESAIPDAMLFDPARLPARDADGHVFHPDLELERWEHPDLGEEYFSTDAFNAAGWEARWVELEYDVDDDHPAYINWQEGSIDYSAWNPSAPEGEGWLLVAVYDSESSPAAMFVRPLRKGRA